MTADGVLRSGVDVVPLQEKWYASWKLGLIDTVRTHDNHAEEDVSRGKPVGGNGEFRRRSFLTLVRLD